MTRPVIIPVLLAVFASSALAGPAATSREIVVFISSHGFSQRSATISPGDRVRFTVRDHKNHQLWKKMGSASGSVPPSVLEGQGATVTLMPAEPGAYSYVDRLNPTWPEFHLVVRR
jgi:plastocyanin